MVKELESAVRKGLKVTGELFLPGDKSISHRAAILAALSEGGSILLANFGLSEDTLATLECLEDLGVQVEALPVPGEGAASEPDSESLESAVGRSRSGIARNGLRAALKMKKVRFPYRTDILVYGRGLKGFREPKEVLDARNSGTTARLLTGLLAGFPFCTILTGDESLRKRPMGRVTLPLRKMGALLLGREDGNLLPLAVQGGELSPLTYTLEVPSAQVKSALLLAALSARGTTAILEPLETRDHTERLLKYMGVPLLRVPAQGKGHSLTISGLHGDPLPKPGGGQLHIPGDLSSASFFIALATLLPCSALRLKNVGLNPTRTAFLDCVKKMGGNILIQDLEEEWEPRGTVVVESAPLRGIEIPPSDLPFLIDEIPLLAVLASQAEGETLVRGAGELRVKESDRIRAICAGLRRLGANIQELEDGFRIHGPALLKGGAVQTYNDHRIAMALAVAGLVARLGTTVVTSIARAECVAVSFPGFWKALERVLR